MPVSQSTDNFCIVCCMQKFPDFLSACDTVDAKQVLYLPKFTVPAPQWMPSRCLAAGLSFSASGPYTSPGAYFACVQPLDMASEQSASTHEVKAGEGAYVRCDTGGLAFNPNRYGPIPHPQRLPTFAVTAPCRSMPWSLLVCRCRWGDYSGIALDPDGRTIWAFNAYKPKQT